MHFFFKLTLYSIVSETILGLCEGLKTFLFAFQENKFFSDFCLNTDTFILFCGLLLNLSHLQGRKADSAVIFV